MDVAIAYEDILQEHVLYKIFATYGLKFNVSIRLSRGGKGYLIKNAKHLNNAAAFKLPVVLLTDLDTAKCPPTLIKDWLSAKLNPDFIFRVATREVESWLIADRLAFSSFLGISKDKLKSNPDEILDPKSYIITLARNSKDRGIRNDIPPLQHTGASIGIGYNSRLVGFVDERWNPIEAATLSPSLNRSIQAICHLHSRLLKATGANEQ